jgi:CTD nuclear envelope phosphatase 1
MTHAARGSLSHADVDMHLLQVSSWYTVVIFTASLPEYADPVIDWLDGGDGRGGMVGARLFRAVR